MNVSEEINLESAELPVGILADGRL